MTRIQHLMTFLMLTVFVFAGCGCEYMELLPDTIEPPDEEPPVEPVKPPTETDPVDPVDEETVDGETDPETFADLPTALPASVKPENYDVWRMIFEASENNPDYVMSLIPDDPDIVLEARVLSKFVGHLDLSSVAFERAYAKALIEKFPNNIPVLHMAVGWLSSGPHASREELLYFIEIWERIKRLNDEQNVPLTSGWRATIGLTHAYVDVEEYGKALENLYYESARIVALEKSGVHGVPVSGTGIGRFFPDWLEAKQREKEAREAAAETE